MTNLKNHFVAALICFSVFALLFGYSLSRRPAHMQSSDSERIQELRQRMSERSTEYQQEAPVAARGKIAEERMKYLHIQNEIDNQELARLEGKQ